MYPYLESLSHNVNFGFLAIYCHVSIFSFDKFVNCFSHEIVTQQRVNITYGYLVGD